MGIVWGRQSWWQDPWGDKIKHGARGHLWNYRGIQKEEFPFYLLWLDIIFYTVFLSLPRREMEPSRFFHSSQRGSLPDPNLHLHILHRQGLKDSSLKVMLVAMIYLSFYEEYTLLKCDLWDHAYFSFLGCELPEKPSFSP